MSTETRAVLFDFNGTLSHDEPIWFQVYEQLYAERGRPITREQYFEQLAGLSDEEGVLTWLGVSDPALIDEGIARYLAAAADGSTVPQSSRDAVAAAAAVVPVGIVTTARRRVLDAVVAAAGLTTHVSLTVTAEDVTRTKPDPEGYLVALARLGDEIDPADVLVFEDTPLGVTAAKEAGMRCAAVLGSAPPERLGHADEIVERLDAETVRRLLPDYRSRVSLSPFSASRSCRKRVSSSASASPDTFGRSSCSSRSSSSVRCSSSAT